eukprot:1868415-Pleurochrysis_carterae.AAC.3
MLGIAYGFIAGYRPRTRAPRAELTAEASAHLPVPRVWWRGQRSPTEAAGLAGALHPQRGAKCGRVCVARDVARP